MIINNKRFVSTILLLATTAVSFATATANKKKPLAFSSVLARSLQGSGACDTGAEHSKIYDQLQARYNDNCVQTDNSIQGDIDMEWYCSKTYGNGIIDAVTYRAYDDTGEEFVPYSYETEGGDPNSPISTAIAMFLFEDPCNAFAEYNGDLEPPDADTICGNQDAHDWILDELNSNFDDSCEIDDWGMGWDWYCSLSYGNGKQQSVVYETWTDGQNFRRPYSISFSQGSPSEGNRVEKQYFENVCDEYGEYLDFEYEFKNPPNPPAPPGCDYEEVNNEVLQVIDSVFEGDKYCSTTTDGSYVFRECESPFGYIQYSAIRPSADTFGASGPPVPEDVYIGLTKNTASYMYEPVAVWEEPCNAADNIWAEMFRTLFRQSNWYYDDDHDDEVYAFGSTATATSSSSSSYESHDFSSYTVEDVIDGFGANWFQDYPDTLSKAAKEDSVDDADVVITGQNDVVVTPSGNITSAPQVDTDVSDGEKASVSSAAVTRAPVLVLAAAATLVAVVGAVL